MKYHENIEIAIKKGLIDESSIHDISLSQHAAEYQQFYDFCIENIEINKKVLGLNDVFIYSKNEYSFKATSHYNGVIEINQSVPHELLMFFEKNKEIFEDPRLSNLKKHESNLDIPFEYLMFQFPMLFIYYHELAHQYHFKNYKKIDSFCALIENGNDEYDETKHLLELDADAYATLMVSEHLVQYNHRVNQENDTNFFHTIIGITIASIALTFFKFTNGNQSLYFKNHTHPHSMVRTMYFIVEMLDVCQSGEHDGKKIDTLNMAIDIVHEMLKNYGMDFNKKYSELMKDNNKGFEDYFNTMKHGLSMNKKLFVSMKF